MKKKLLEFLYDLLFYSVGAFLFAVSVNVFSAPNEISGGGVTGLAIVINYLIGTPIGMTALLFNIPLFLWGYLKIGKSFVKKSLAATVVTSVIIDLTSGLFLPYTGDLMLACIFGGAFSGVGLGLVFMRGATTGGSDLAAGILKSYKPNLSVGRLILIIDAAIVLISAAAFKNIESALYASILIFISSKVIDAVIYGTGNGNGKLVFIVSKNSREISSRIGKELKRGVTYLRGSGAYSNEQIDVIMCAVYRKEFFKVENIALKTDPNCFIIAGEANDIRGEGFTREANKEL